MPPSGRLSCGFGVWLMDKLEGEDKLIRIACCVCFGLSTLASVVVIIVVTTTPSQTEKFEDRLCLPSPGQGSLDCDVSLNTYLDQIISRELEEQAEVHFRSKLQEKPLAYKESTTDKPAARVTGDRKSKTSPDSPVGRIVENWRFQPSGFIKNGIKYRGGRLVVPVKGLYWVYSFLDLFEPWNTTSANMPDKSYSESISHEIYSYNILNGTQNLLVSTKQPRQVSPNEQYNIYGSFLESIETLEAGDEIYVNVSHISYLTNPQANYFGIQMI